MCLISTIVANEQLNKQNPSSIPNNKQLACQSVWVCQEKQMEIQSAQLQYILSDSPFVSHNPYIMNFRQF